MRPASVAAAALLLAVLWGCGEPADVHRFSFASMGTAGSGVVEVWDRTIDRSPAEVVVATLDSVEARLSSWREDSEVGRLNAAPADTVIPVSLWLSECLRVGEALGRGSGGAFDPTAGPLMELWGFRGGQGRLPTPAEVDSARALMGRYTYDAANRTVVKHDPRCRFDLGGIAKGLAVDLAVANLQELGISAALIDLGGNLYALGKPQGRDAWTVGIRDPRDRDRLLAVFRTWHRAVASSGSYERFVEIDGRRYGHIMNPATGRPAEGLLGVTVIHPSATLCDGLSTTLFVVGPDEAVRLLRETYREVEAVLVLPPEPGMEKARVVATPGLRGNLELSPGREADAVLTYLER